MSNPEMLAIAPKDLERMASKGFTFYKPDVFLGKGGFGAVFKARLQRGDIRVDGDVAAKIIGNISRENGFNSGLIVRELANLCELRHPNLLRLYDVFSVNDGTAVIFFLELMTGGSLAELILSRPLPEQLIATIYRQVVQGLDTMHAARFVHRDLKPGNILLKNVPDGATIAKIADFGQSILLDGYIGGRLAICGTIPYMAPEVLKAGQVRNREERRRLLGSLLPTDIWSLGITLYCAVQGNVPWYLNRRPPPPPVVAAPVVAPVKPQGAALNPFEASFRPMNPFEASSGSMNPFNTSSGPISGPTSGAMNPFEASSGTPSYASGHKESRVFRYFAGNSFGGKCNNNAKHNNDNSLRVVFHAEPEEPAKKSHSFCHQETMNEYGQTLLGRQLELIRQEPDKAMRTMEMAHHDEGLKNLILAQLRFHPGSRPTTGQIMASPWYRKWLPVGGGFEVKDKYWEQEF